MSRALEPATPAAQWAGARAGADEDLAVEPIVMVIDDLESWLGLERDEKA